MTNNELHELKQYYLASHVSEEKVDQLWQDLSGNLPPRMETPYYFRARYAFLSLFALILLGVSITLVQAASPDSTLYPVRVLADTISAKVTGKYSPVIEKRTDDVMQAVKKNSTTGVEKATNALSNSLDDVKSASLSSESKSRVKKTLQESENKLRAVTPANENAESRLNEAIKTTEETQQDVKGANTTRGNSADNANPNSGETNSKPEDHGQSDSHGNNSK